MLTSTYNNENVKVPPNHAFDPLGGDANMCFRIYLDSKSKLPVVWHGNKTYVVLSDWLNTVEQSEPCAEDQKEVPLRKTMSRLSAFVPNLTYHGIHRMNVPMFSAIACSHVNESLTPSYPDIKLVVLFNEFLRLIKSWNEHPISIRRGSAHRRAFLKQYLEDFLTAIGKDEEWDWKYLNYRAKDYEVYEGDVNPVHSSFPHKRVIPVAKEYKPSTEEVEETPLKETPIWDIGIKKNDICAEYNRDIIRLKQCMLQYLTPEENYSVDRKLTYLQENTTARDLPEVLYTGSYIYWKLRKILYKEIDDSFEHLDLCKNKLFDVYLKFCSDLHSLQQ